MNILVGKTFGLGNAVMSVPMIKALTTLGNVSILVGSSKDDKGAFEVFEQLKFAKIIEQIYIDYTPQMNFDIAIMAIPFDGRWKNGIHFFANSVLDCRPRPDFSPVLGFSSWKKHEYDYQMDNAREIGYCGPIQSSSFIFNPKKSNNNLIYLGLGFKRDAAGFWSKKHWGNARYTEFMQSIHSLKRDVIFMTTGNEDDEKLSEELRKYGLKFFRTNFVTAFNMASECGSYFGNDTGMMHVMASLNKPVYAMNAFDGAEIKNSPLCEYYVFEQFYDIPRDPDDVAKDFMKFVWR